MIKKKYISLLLFFSSLALSASGFSSWVIGTAGFPINTVNNSLSVSLLSSQLAGLYYVSGSANSFDYQTTIDGNYKINDPSFKMDLKMDNIGLTKAYKGKPDTYLYLSLQYSSPTDINIFSSNNEYITPPTRVKARIKSMPFYFIVSDTIKYSSFQNSDKTAYTYNLSTKLLVYSETKYSLYSLGQDYHPGNIQDFTLTFDFDIKEGNKIEQKAYFDNFANLNFIMSFNLEERSYK